MIQPTEGNDSHAERRTGGNHLRTTVVAVKILQQTGNVLVLGLAVTKAPVTAKAPSKDASLGVESDGVVAAACKVGDLHVVDGADAVARFFEKNGDPTRSVLEME